jgi:hypothetical protein
MLQRRLGVVLTLVCTLSACHSLAAKKQPASAPAPASQTAANETADTSASSDASPQSAEGMPKAETAEIPPCLPADNNPKPAPKRKPKPVVHVEPPAPAPVAAPTPKVAGEAGVKAIATASASILGKKVRGQEGDDLGRVVDVLADAQGRVRIAIIEFGGFLGVGNRRIAVDWALLKFQPDAPDAPVLLDVPKSKLQGTPEYKGSERPLVLMAPEAPATPPPTTPN